MDNLRHLFEKFGFQQDNDVCLTYTRYMAGMILLKGELSESHIRAAFDFIKALQEDCNTKDNITRQNLYDSIRASYDNVASDEEFVREMDRLILTVKESTY